MSAEASRNKNPNPWGFRPSELKACNLLRSPAATVSWQSEMPCKKKQTKKGGCNLGILKNKKHEAIRLVPNFVREISINQRPRFGVQPQPWPIISRPRIPAEAGPRHRTARQRARRRHGLAKVLRPSLRPRNLQTLHRTSSDYIPATMPQVWFWPNPDDGWVPASHHHLDCLQHATEHYDISLQKWR